jgi:hypothetical protein
VFLRFVFVTSVLESVINVLGSATSVLGSVLRFVLATSVLGSVTSVLGSEMANINGVGRAGRRLGLSLTSAFLP